MDQMFCKIYLYTEAPYEKLITLIAQILEGSKSGIGSIESEIFEVDLDKNDEYSEEDMRNADRLDAFLYYPYTLDIEPKNNIVDREKYIDGIAKFIERLSESGIQVVTACDFEEKLPQNGRFEKNRV